MATFWKKTSMNSHFLFSAKACSDATIVLAKFFRDPLYRAVEIHLSYSHLNRRYVCYKTTSYPGSGLPMCARLRVDMQLNCVTEMHYWIRWRHTPSEFSPLGNYEIRMGLGRLLGSDPFLYINLAGSTDLDINAVFLDTEGGVSGEWEILENAGRGIIISRMVYYFKLVFHDYPLFFNYFDIIFPL